MTQVPATQQTAANIVGTDQADWSVKFTPLAESDDIFLTVSAVMNNIAVKTKSGKVPNRGDVIKFMMLCKTRRLNPFAGDAYLIGYDSREDGPTFQLIVAIQALRKRAEANPNFDGGARGVIVKSEGVIVEREGTMVFDGEALLGGWSVCHRKDNKIPFRETVKLSTYSTGKSRWAKDPEGMIAKVAEAAALRRAFPSDVGGLYIQEEFDSVESPAAVAAAKAKGKIPDRLAALSARPEPGTAPQASTTTVIEQAAPEATSEPQGEPEREQASEGTEPAADSVAQAMEAFTKQIAAAQQVADVNLVMMKAQDSPNIDGPAWDKLNELAAAQMDTLEEAEQAAKKKRK